MKVTVKGKGDVSLTQANFVAQGGQASVYIRSGTAYKIYTDPKDAIPEAKFHDLNGIQDDHVIKPLELLLDPKSNLPIGYTMNAVTKEPASLCQLFTRAFRDRNGITHANILDVVNRLRHHVACVHHAGVVVVDLNELNLLVPKTWNDVYMIDVDSFQTKGFPATVIMPSVRDFSVRSNDFSPLSDWYSYGILAFQLFIGIHPYKGTHEPSNSVDKDKRLEHRMRHNISAFRPDVSLPKACYGFDQIPQQFKDWLVAVLDQGKRLIPPDPHGGPAVAVGVAPLAPVFIGGGNLIITDVADYTGWRVLAYEESAQHALALLHNGTETRIMMDGRVLLSTHLSGTTLIGFTGKMNQPVALNLHNGQVTFYDLNRKTQEVLSFSANEMAKSGPNFYVRNGNMVLEVEFAEMPQKTIVTASTLVADVLELASRLYEGCVIQSMLGAAYVSLFPESKTGCQVRIPELDKYRIHDAKFDGGVLMVAGSKNGRYDRLVFRFDPSHTSYDLRVIEGVAPTGLNFITLAQGICVCLTEEEKIEAFSARKDKAGVKVVDDPALGNDMRLLKIKGKAGFERAGKLAQISLK